jgi:hypothetical protein
MKHVDLREWQLSEDVNTEIEIHHTDELGNIKLSLLQVVSIKYVGKPSKISVNIHSCENYFTHTENTLELTHNNLLPVNIHLEDCLYERNAIISGLSPESHVVVTRIHDRSYTVIKNTIGVIITYSEMKKIFDCGFETNRIPIAGLYIKRGNKENLTGKNVVISQHGGFYLSDVWSATMFDDWYVIFFTDTNKFTKLHYSIGLSVLFKNDIMFDISGVNENDILVEINCDIWCTGNGMVCKRIS